jgi:flagellar biosynthesis/type III secretory pathway chaperone
MESKIEQTEEVVQKIDSLTKALTEEILKVFDYVAIPDEHKEKITTMRKEIENTLNQLKENHKENKYLIRQLKDDTQKINSYFKSFYEKAKKDSLT